VEDQDPKPENQEPKPEEQGGPDAEEWRVRYLDPEQIELVDGGGGTIHLLEKDRGHVAVRFRWCFPQSMSGRYLSISNMKDEEIGVVVDPRKLSRDSLALAERGIEVRYFVPKITRFKQASEKAGLVYCVVETDRGPREFSVSDPRSHVQNPEGERYLIEDVHGNRYEVEDLEKLDERSQVQATALV
jgi:hypothetical protein